MNQHASPRCRYHAEKPGHWSCSDCNLHLCTDCKPFAECLPIDVECPLCRRPMDEPGAQTDASPRGPRHPLGIHYSVWIATVLLALVAASVPWPLPGVFVALPAGLFLLAEMTLLARAAGEAWTDRRILGRFLEYEHCEFALHGIGFALPFVAAWLIGLGMQSTLMMVLVMAAAAALMPVTLISTLIAGGAWEGLRPRLIARVIRTLGSSYATLVAATAIPMALTWSVVVAAPSGILSSFLAPGLAVAAAFYALLWSHRLGALANRHRRILEYAAGIPGIDRPKRPAPEQFEPALWLADADVLIRERRTGPARALLARALTRYPDHPELNERFERLLQDTDDTKMRKSYIERRIQRLIKAGHPRDAVELWRRNSPGLDGWMPSVPALRHKLALELERMGDHAIAFRLLVSLPMKARGIGQPGAAWLRAATILEENLADPDRAAQLRRVIAEKTAAGGRARSLSEKRCTDAARADRDRRLSSDVGRERVRRTAS